MKVSVVIPCLNAEPYLSQAIQSLVNQTAPPAEILVADNGSNDGSRDIARSFGNSVKLLEVPKRGASRARLAGVEQASGDALMFLDADDLVAPETLEAMSRALTADEGDIACAPWYRFEQSGGAWHWAPPSCAPRKFGQDDLSAWLTGWYHPPCSVLWTRKAYDRSGGWDPDIGVNDDGDVMMRGLARGNSLARIENGAGFYRRIPGGESLSSTAQTLEGIQSRLAVLERLEKILEEREQLRSYGAAFHDAYSLIASQIPASEPAAQKRCATALRRHSQNATGSNNRPERAPSGIARYAGLPIGAGPPGPPPEQGLSQECAKSTSRDQFVKNDSPLISVVIPAFNREDTIGRALESVLSQDYAPIEVLVIDDGSTDRTCSVVRNLDDERVRLVSQENSGVSAARNRGISQARGEFIALLDSDDEWLPGKLRRQTDAFRSGPSSLGLVYCGVEIVRPGGEDELVTANHRGWIFRDMLDENVVLGSCSNGLFRKDALNLLGGFDTAFEANEDYDLCLRLSRFFQVDCIDGIGSRYFDEADTAAPSGPVRVSRNAEANRRARERFFERYEIDLRRGGVAHMFFVRSANRELYLSGGSLRTAARLAARAIRKQPLAKFSYRWALTKFLPTFLRRISSRLL